MKHTGDSANIAFYQGDDGVWCEVLRNDFTWRTGKMTKMPLPNFNVRIYRTGVGVLTEIKYRPRKPVAAGCLPEATVTRLVKAALKAPRE